MRTAVRTTVHSVEAIRKVQLTVSRNVATLAEQLDKVEAIHHNDAMSEAVN